MYSTEKVQETYWCSSSIACQEKRTDCILTIFTFNDKNPLYLPIISTLQFFWGSKWSRSNLSSHKTIWHIWNIRNSEFKIKQMPGFFQTAFYFLLIFLDNTSHKFCDQSPFPHSRCCLQVSETVSWHKIQCCYSANILQHWVGSRALVIWEMWTIPEFTEFFPGNELVLEIYLRQCSKAVVSKKLSFVQKSHGYQNLVTLYKILLCLKYSQNSLSTSATITGIQPKMKLNICYGITCYNKNWNISQLPFLTYSTLTVIIKETAATNIIFHTIPMIFFCHQFWFMIGSNSVAEIWHFINQRN